MNELSMKKPAIKKPSIKNQWISVCHTEEITPDTGVCALVNGEQVAIFRESRNDQFYAVSNYDPCSGANVIARGLIGSLGNSVIVASPIYKQHFDLDTGICLEETDKQLTTYEVRIVKERIEIRA